MQVNIIQQFRKFNYLYRFKSIVFQSKHFFFYIEDLKNLS